MPVPRMSQLEAGVGVNIVLKADQPTGRLTKGIIADILTRGDHPRGIKVRLTSGQVGRVQSLSGQQAIISPESSSPFQDMPENNRRQGGQRGRNNRRGRPNGGMYDDQPVPRSEEAPSLFDYVRPARQSRQTAGPNAAMPNNTLGAQEQLELEFPSMDSALIAAIVVDYPDLAEARTVLSSLS